MFVVNNVFPANGILEGNQQQVRQHSNVANDSHADLTCV